MSESSGSGVAGSLELFEEFVARLAKGLGVRVESEVESTPAETVPVTREALTADAPAGALLGRTVWNTDDNAHSGCFLWIGNVGGLLGGGDRPVAGLSPEELQTLDQSLRLNVEEGGEDDLLLQWSDLEIAAPESLSDTLRECGVPATTEAFRFGLRIGETELSFLFFDATGESASADAGSDAAAPSGSGDAEGSAVESVPVGPPDPAHLEQLLDLRLPLTIRLGSTRMTLDEVLRLGPGSVVELDEREDQPLEVLANGRVVARGQVVVVDERFGLRITEVGSSAERLAASS